MPRHVENPNNTTSSGQDHVDPWNRSSSWWDRNWQGQDQWYDRSWQDNRDWDNRARSAQPTSSTETSGRGRSGPTRTSRFTQDRNRRGHRSVAATQRRIDRGQERRRQAEQAAQQAQAATQTEPPQGDTAPPEPSRPPRVSTGERRARSAPPPGQAALEANEEAEASLVPRKDHRRRDKAKGRATRADSRRRTGRGSRGGATSFVLRSCAHSSKGTGRALHQRSPAHSGPASARGPRRDRSRGS